MMRISSYVIAAPIPRQAFHILMPGYTGAVDKVSSRLGEFMLARRGEVCGLGDDPLTRLRQKAD